ncbi:MAG: carboxypeptidase-like regulatory domain-containing protein [Marinilabiliaceae bacterium]|nr:carboxypeptidase-like regulatory domain-containing protein [Marinilabiliaceae bacterium]
MKTLCMILVVLANLAVNNMFSQDDERILCGIVVDKHTLKPLANAVMHTEKQSYLADDMGRISARVHVGDVIAFTHVGYQPVRMQVADSLSFQSVFSIKMSEDTLTLPEVTVRPRQIKLEYLERVMPVREKLEDVVARINFKNATLIALHTKPTIIDAEMATKRQMESFVNKQINEGMMPTSIKIGLPSNLILGVLRLVNFDRKETDVDIRPISESEIESLMK